MKIKQERIFELILTYEEFCSLYYVLDSTTSIDKDILTKFIKELSSYMESILPELSN